MNEYEREQYAAKSMADPLISAVATAISTAHEIYLNETQPRSPGFYQNVAERGPRLAKYWVEQAAAAIEAHNKHLGAT